MDKMCKYLVAFLSVVLLINVGLLLIESRNIRKITLNYKSDLAIIDYDENHIPHITGTSDEAIYYGLGHAHAMDRLWQIDLLRHLSSGKLSEVISINFSQKYRFLVQILYNSIKQCVHLILKK